MRINRHTIWFSFRHTKSLYNLLCIRLWCKKNWLLGLITLNLNSCKHAWIANCYRVFCVRIHVSFFRKARSSSSMAILHWSASGPLMASVNVWRVRQRRRLTRIFVVSWVSLGLRGYVAHGQVLHDWNPAEQRCFLWLSDLDVAFPLLRAHHFVLRNSFFQKIFPFQLCSRLMALHAEVARWMSHLLRPIPVWLHYIHYNTFKTDRILEGFLAFVFTRFFVRQFFLSCTFVFIRGKSTRTLTVFVIQSSLFFQQPFL